MSTDQQSPGTDNAAERGKSGPASQPIGNPGSAARDPQGHRRDVVGFLRLAGRHVVEDAAARFIPELHPGRRMLKHPTPVFFLIIASFIIKVVARGKRRAELTANEATKRAETEQLERTVLEARMEALQAQIEPHFLFNTLASIDQLIQTDPPRASKMQQSLIRYLRSAMPQMREGSRPSLGQQVDLSSALLEIMAVRMEERLQPVVNVPEGLKSAVFPSMMLQTLVENAIKHGLEPKAEGGRLEIGAEIVDGQLAVHVLDTGAGFMPKAEGRRGAGQYPRAIAGLVRRPGRADHQRAARGRYLCHDQSPVRNRSAASLIDAQHAPISPPPPP